MNKMDLRAELKNKIYKRKEKSQAPKWVFFIVMTVCLTSVLVFLNDDLHNIIFKSKRNEAPTMPLIEKTKDPIRSRPEAKKLESVISPGTDKPKQTNQEKPAKRQTEFNDNNYVARGAHNITPAITTNSTGYNQERQQKEKFRYTRSIAWTWESYGSGFSKHAKRGRFTYIETENGIDTASVCANYTYGSLDYRDCRKAAKKWFKEKCSNTFPQACLAGNMIP